MAEIDPASDNGIAVVKEIAESRIKTPGAMPVMPVDCVFLLAIIARLRKAEKERDEARKALKPTYFANADDWEFTTDDISHITDDLSWNDCVRVRRFAELPDKWVARIPIDTDGDGEADDSEIRWFDTEEEVRRAARAKGGGDE